MRALPSSSSSSSSGSATKHQLIRICAVMSAILCLGCSCVCDTPRALSCNALGVFCGTTCSNNSNSRNTSSVLFSSQTIMLHLLHTHAHVTALLMYFLQVHSRHLDLPRLRNRRLEVPLLRLLSAAMP